MLVRKVGLLGRVNPLALEEFKALEERHAFLSDQLDDLRRSKRDLEEVVVQVDDRIRSVFEEAYRDVAREFELTFQTVFPGGAGRLVLTDPSDMLTTGIEVEARPPGKKVTATVAAVRWGAVADRAGLRLRHLPGATEPVLRPRRGRRGARRRQPPAAAEGRAQLPWARADHHGHAPEAVDGDRRRPLRHHDGPGRRDEGRRRAAPGGRREAGGARDPCVRRADRGDRRRRVAWDGRRVAWDGRRVAGIADPEPAGKA